MSSLNPFAKKKEDTVGSLSEVTPRSATSSGLFSSFREKKPQEIETDEKNLD
jgi:hypothetical protein